MKDIDNIDDWEDSIIFDNYLKTISVSKETYITFIKHNVPFYDWKDETYFSKYYDVFTNSAEYKTKIEQKSFSKLSDDEQEKIISDLFYSYVESLEKEKLLYFSLVYNQKTLIITAPDDSKKQEAFLGFKWSDKKGQEGIQPLPQGGALCSMHNRHDNTKLSWLIKNSFSGIYTEVPELKEYYYHTELKDLIDFTTINFNKVISTVPKETPKNIFPKKYLSEFQVDIDGALTRIEASQIQENGATPVISQTKDRFIEGYTDVSDIISDVPLVLFGDHTCVAKYINFPFVRGADGTQLIKTDASICLPEYLCIYLNFANIPNKNKYERHFKYIKKMLIPIPDIPIQEKIIKDIHSFDTSIENCVRNIENYRKDIIEKFMEMFGDPITNTKNWDKDILKNRCDVITGNTPSRKVLSYYGNYIEWIKSDNINTPNDYLTVAEEYLSEEGLAVGRSVDAGSILMTCIAGSKECIGNIAIANRKVSFNQQINAIVPKNNNTWFLYFLFKQTKEIIKNTASNGMKGILSKGKLENIEFIFPPIELQNAFGNYVSEIMKKIAKKTSKQQKLIDEKNAMLESLLI